MSDLTRFTRFYRYPYFHWGKAITSLLQTADISDDAIFVDAPCGDGVVTFWGVKNGLGKSFELYDLSEKDIRRAERLKNWHRMRGKDIRVERADVHDIPIRSESARDVWFLINSLFLLPKIDALIERMRPRIEHIVGLFPVVESRNYQCYKKRNPTINANEMSRNQILKFFAKHGYDQRGSVDASFIPHHCLQPMRLQQVARYAMNPIGNVVSRKDPCYWAGLFTRV